MGPPVEKGWGGEGRPNGLWVSCCSLESVKVAQGVLCFLEVSMEESVLCVIEMSLRSVMGRGSGGQ